MGLIATIITTESTYLEDRHRGLDQTYPSPQVAEILQ